MPMVKAVCKTVKYEDYLEKGSVFHELMKGRFAFNIFCRGKLV